ncbi:MAG: cysteine--tRNA ligase [Candidatus Paceibacterota bacterium]|jgi:cysteinyl-tRNA synthetase
MEIKIYNTSSRKIETFEPLKKGVVSMYHCGPTVYDTPHIGNYRTFIFYDLVRRLFEYNGYKIAQAMNITDVDDKTIKRSREEAVDLKTLTSKYEKMFLDGLDALNIKRPEHILRATEYVDEMIRIIGILLEKGVAYKTSDGIYLSIDKVPNYGALAHLDLSKSDQSQERIANDEYDKENPRDFALWKFKTPDDGPVSWQTPFGEGRPGWHIECSAMSMKVLGETIDIHTGGVDLLFPHHTNEIAQSESVTGKQFVRYWMHGAFITVDGEKMAKSKRNFLKLEDLLEQSVSPLAYRYWSLTAHYRSPVNFTWEAIKAAQTALIRMIGIFGTLPNGGVVNMSYKERFNECVNDDLNMPKAIALSWELLKDPVVIDADKRSTLLDFDLVLGLRLDSSPKVASVEIPAEIQALAEARELARSEKDWQKADALRQEIGNRGFVIDDTPNGIVIRQAD